MKIAFIAAQTEFAAAALARLVAIYGTCPPKEAEVIVALGGDGLMLECLHRVLGTDPAGIWHELRLSRVHDERVRGG